MIDYAIREDDLTGSEVIALLTLHLDEMRAWSPPESVHAMPVDRKPAKFSDGFGKGAKWNTQVRYFEHRLVGYVMPIVTALLCTLLVGLASLAEPMWKKLEEKNNERKAENAAEEVEVLIHR